MLKKVILLLEKPIATNAIVKSVLMLFYNVLGAVLMAIFKKNNYVYIWKRYNRDKRGAIICYTLDGFNKLVYNMDLFG